METWVLVTALALLGLTALVILSSRRIKTPELQKIVIRSRFLGEGRRIEVVVKAMGRVMVARIGYEWYAYAWVPLQPQIHLPVAQALQRMAEDINRVLPGALKYEHVHIVMSTNPYTLPPHGVVIRLKVPSVDEAEDMVYRVLYAVQEQIKRTKRVVIMPTIFPMFLFVQVEALDKTVLFPPPPLPEEPAVPTMLPAPYFPPPAPQGQQPPYPMEEEGG